VVQALIQEYARRQDSQLGQNLPRAGWMRRAYRALLLFSHFGFGSRAGARSPSMGSGAEGMLDEKRQVAKFCEIERGFDFLKINCVKLSKNEQIFASNPENLVVRSGMYVFHD
jgi:hypothetical protein